MASLGEITVKIHPGLSEEGKTLLRQLIQEEIQALLKATDSSETIQVSVRRIAREEIEAFKKEQSTLVRRSFGPQERKGEA